METAALIFGLSLVYPGDILLIILGKKQLNKLIVNTICLLIMRVILN
ncbi:hypothetical protein SAMN02910370_02788 [Lachnospiraceae bacterium XPB1003]|nr:hypothetical protein SAMN02910370_02788 [Lachnospiraceae bacterium XPB1003]